MVKDLSGLPTASTSDRGELPHVEAQAFLLPLAQQWYDEYLASGDDDRAFAVPGTRFRASWAGGCARALAYRVLHNDAKMALAAYVAEGEGIETPIEQLQSRVDEWAPTNPPTLSEVWNMRLGSNVHELFDHAVKATFPGAEVEQAIDLRPDVDGSASSDVIIRIRTEDLDPTVRGRIYHEDWKTADGEFGTEIPETTIILLELKTVGGFKFKKATMSFKGQAEGPSLGHQLQVGLAARAYGAHAVVIGYLSKENISKQIAKSNQLSDVERFLAGWIYSMAQLDGVLKRETKRVARVLQLVDEGTLPPRMIFDGEMPPTAEIQNVENGFWTVTDEAGNITASDTTWWCAYCWHRDRCAVDGVGMVPVTIRGSA